MTKDTPASRVAMALHVLADNGDVLRELAAALRGSDESAAAKAIARSCPEVRAALGGVTQLAGDSVSREMGAAIIGAAIVSSQLNRHLDAQRALKSFLARGGLAS